MNFTILRFEEISSTNTEAISQAKRGADEGLCVIAKRQTSGRGRHGRNWISPENAGLYFSIVLRPKIEMRFLPLLTLMSAVAVSDVLRETYDIKPDIKWANDIHINDRKICGILAETAETKKGLAVIVGIGINLSSDAFPVELNDIATSIEDETNLKADAEELLNALTRFLNYYYEIFQGENGAKHILDEWKKRSSYAFGKQVKVKLEKEEFIGTTDGLEENGALRVRMENDNVRIIQSGDVERLRRVIE